MRWMRSNMSIMSVFMRAVPPVARAAGRAIVTASPPGVARARRGNAKRRPRACRKRRLRVCERLAAGAVAAVHQVLELQVPPEGHQAGIGVAGDQRGAIAPPLQRPGCTGAPTRAPTYALAAC